MKNKRFFWLALIGGTVMIILVAVGLMSLLQSQGILVAKTAAEAATDEAYITASSIAKEINSPLIILEVDQPSEASGGGFTQPLSVEGLPNKELIMVSGIFSPNFTIKDTSRANNQNQPNRSLSAEEQTQAASSLKSINERFLSKLQATGYTIVDTASQNSPVGYEYTSTYLKSSSRPEIICDFTVEKGTNTSGFGCVLEKDYLSRANELKPFIIGYRANKNFSQAQNTAFGLAEATPGENGYEIRELSFAGGRTIFYRKIGSTNWTAGNVQFSYQTLPSCQELKKDPDQVVAMAGYAVVDGRQKYRCFKGNGVNDIDVSTSM